MSSQFWRICKANGLLYFSVFALFPSLALQIAEYSDVFIFEGALVFVTFIAGRILAGPCTSYLVDTFKRKYVCTTGWIVISLIIFLYHLNGNFTQFLLLGFLQGLAYGVVSSCLIVLSTDLVDSEKRDRGNIIFSYFTRSGMFFGIALGSYISLFRDFSFVVNLSLFAGVTGLIYLLMVRVPFRAPIGATLFSLDRFILPRSWILFFNLFLVAVVPGIFVPLIHYDVTHLWILQTGWELPFSVFLFAGYVITMLFIRTAYKIKRIIIGMSLLVVSVSLFILSGTAVLSILAAIMLGISLALISPVIQVLFIDMSRHCERVSANVTCSLSWDIGIVAGIVISCYLKDNYTSLAAYQVALFSATIAFALFILVSLRFYCKDQKS